MIASRLADPEWLEARRARWYTGANAAARTVQRVSSVATAAHTHASLRSVWFVNSLRGAVALAVAVAVADVTTVQHGFWVVLGTLSVLRTNASATGATALRAIAGTAIGFVIGGALVLAIGSDETALWIVFPFAVLVAAYSPGTAPFAVGQAAFTVLIAILFNLIVPVGWKVGVVRIEDVALGCAVSAVIGTLFWPRGVSSVVGDDLADAFRTGASYLTQAVQWATGARADEPDAAMPRGHRGSPPRRGPAWLPRRAGKQAHRQAGPVAPRRRVAPAASHRARRGGDAGRCDRPRRGTRRARAPYRDARVLVRRARRAGRHAESQGRVRARSRHRWPRRASSTSPPARTTACGCASTSIT